MKMKLLLALVIACGIAGAVCAQEPVDETPRGPLAADKEMPDSNDAAAGGVESWAGKSQPLVSDGANGSGLSPEEVSGDLSALRAKLTEQAAENAVQGAHLLDEPANVRDLLRLRTLDFLGLAACQNLVKTQDGTQFLVWLLNDDALMQEAGRFLPNRQRPPGSDEGHGGAVVENLAAADIRGARELPAAGLWCCRGSRCSGESGGRRCD